MSGQTVVIEGVSLEQDDRFFKLGQDTVLLSAFAALRPGERALDLGAGVGFLGVLTLLRNPGRVDGWELEAEAAALAQRNYARCGLTERGTVRQADLREAAAERAYDVCLSNPPYYEPCRGKTSGSPTLGNARSQQTASIIEVCRAAGRALRSGGRCYLCWKPEQTAALFAACRAARLEPKRLRLVQQRPGTDAILLLLEARKDGGAGLRIQPPLVVETETGEKTAEYLAAYRRA